MFGFFCPPRPPHFLFASGASIPLCSAESRTVCIENSPAAFLPACSYLRGHTIFACGSVTSRLMALFQRLLAMARGHGQEFLPSLAKITIDDIGRGLDDKRFTVVGLVEAHLARIKEVNGVFNAVLEINPDALAIAHELDREMKERGRRGWVS